VPDPPARITAQAWRRAAGEVEGLGRRAVIGKSDTGLDDCARCMVNSANVGSESSAVRLGRKVSERGTVALHAWRMSTGCPAGRLRGLGSSHRPYDHRLLSSLCAAGGSGELPHRGLGTNKQPQAWRSVAR
jgi:hypothetical protein